MQGVRGVKHLSAWSAAYRLRMSGGGILDPSGIGAAAVQMIRPSYSSLALRPVYLLILEDFEGNYCLTGLPRRTVVTFLPVALKVKSCFIHSGEEMLAKPLAPPGFLQC